MQIRPIEIAVLGLFSSNHWQLMCKERHLSKKQVNEDFKKSMTARNRKRNTNWFKNYRKLQQQGKKMSILSENIFLAFLLEEFET